MRLRLYNAKILPSPESKLIDGEVLIENGTIRSIGAGAPRFAADREIDCRGNLLMSGFCNAHAHAAMCLFRGIADDLTLERWLYDRIFPLEENLNEDDIYWGTMLQIAEFVRGGITCFADMYFFPDSVAAAAKNANLCLALCCGSNAVKDEEVVRDIANYYTKFSNMSDRLRYFPGVHAEYTSTERLLEMVADFAAECGSPTCIHLSETLKEVGDCTVRHSGLTPPQYLHKIGYFDNGGIAAHCVYADKDDLALLKQSGVVPVVNGASNLKLASGVAPVASMLRMQMRPALGTDGTASNNAASMFREMYLYACLQKEMLKDASAVSAAQALAAATENGYRALGFQGGSLRPGRLADLVLIDLSAPNLQPPSGICGNLVYSASESNVLLTIAGGKVVYEYGDYHIGEPLEKIYGECRKRQKRLMSQASA